MRNLKIPILLFLSLSFVLADAALARDDAEPTSCVACHGSTDWFGEEHVAMAAPFRGDAEPDDAHAAVGLSCHDCHGGNPDPALAEDLDAAMDPEWEANPYRGPVARTEIPELCGSCHSDPVYMRRFDPSARVDQLDEYWTSHHGELLREGRDDVATCADCHGDPTLGSHAILPVGDPGSSAYPTRVAETCNGCHGDAELMAGATTDYGQPLPVDQFARWSSSVHAAALLERGDLSAPTCNDCHGNHGATPPGVESISFVCGQCHGREARLFRDSPKQAAYEEHNLLMEGLGPGACAECHVEPEPAASVTTVDHFSECASCHGEHGVQRPTLAMLTPLPETPCAYCHEGPGLESVDPERLERYETERNRLVGLASAEGLEGDERFDFLVDRALELRFHTEGEGSEDEESDAEQPLRPEFARLFEKYRVGKTTRTWTGPDGELHHEKVVQCRDCHAEEPMLASSPAGLDTARSFAEGLHEVAAATAQAERLLLRAHRGGVSTREGMTEIDAAVDSLISMEVLVHSFDDEGSFDETRTEAMGSAERALAAGRAGLDELVFRRRGLAVALLFVGLVALALWLTIRTLDRERREDLSSAEDIQHQESGA